MEEGTTPYQVLARKYRHTKLSELQGQELLATVLKKALKTAVWAMLLS